MARTALHILARVQPGNRIDVRVPEPLKAGDEVEVVVLTCEDGVRGDRSILEILDGLPPDIGMFKTAEEVDAYIREERDSWER